MSHTLLLADDSITIQRVIELTFAEEDVKVLAVGDGKHAIDRIQAERPDIVLADVGMPEQDGYEVAAFVKGTPHLAHIPVLLLTGAFEPIDEQRARMVGCDGVLVKPFEPQMVINRVKDLLAGKKPAGSNNATPDQPRPVVSGQESYVPRAANQGDSLEEYFDRLDAAFANLSSEPGGAAPHAVVAPPAPPPPVAEASTPLDLSTWDPDLSGDALQPALRAPIPLVQTPAPIPLVQEPPPELHIAPVVEPVPLAAAPPPMAMPVPVIPVANEAPAPPVSHAGASVARRGIRHLARRRARTGSRAGRAAPERHASPRRRRRHRAAGPRSSSPGRHATRRPRRRGALSPRGDRPNQADQRLGGAR